MKDCCIIIPTHKEHLSNSEYVSISRLYKLLGNKYDIKYVIPQGLDLTEYANICEKYTGSTYIEYVMFAKSFFEDIYGYNILFTIVDLYLNFIDYKYIYIYHTDCYLLYDNIQYWIDKDLNQVECIYENENEVFFNGEGLRKVQYYLDWLYDNQEKVIQFQSKILLLKIYNLLYLPNYYGEDIFYTIYMDINIYYEYYKFGISVHLNDIIEKYGLPMMIHALNNKGYISVDKNLIEEQKQLIGDWDVDPEGCINKVFDI